MEKRAKPKQNNKLKFVANLFKKKTRIQEDWYEVYNRSSSSRRKKEKYKSM